MNSAEQTYTEIIDTAGKRTLVAEDASYVFEQIARAGFDESRLVELTKPCGDWWGIRVRDIGFVAVTVEG